ncbi:MAG TPA: DUF192 domain-containing protein [Thermoanaerobaculaceae bacterium]|mgnify:CR=1 FL=1|nr:DUF192 domain-containing protein [Thermoanaerobaculaceae bacterium]
MTTALLALLLTLSSPPKPVCTAPDGATIHLEVAVTDDERQLGLMFRDVVPPDTGMLFLFSSDAIWPFWMKNTQVPLDFIWLDAQGKVVEVRPDVPPCYLDPCPSFAPTATSRAMLEMAAGSAARHALKPGTVLRFASVPGYPIPTGK